MAESPIGLEYLYTLVYSVGADTHRHLSKKAVDDLYRLVRTHLNTHGAVAARSMVPTYDYNGAKVTPRLVIGLSSHQASTFALDFILSKDFGPLLELADLIEKTQRIVPSRILLRKLDGQRRTPVSWQSLIDIRAAAAVGR